MHNPLKSRGKNLEYDNGKEFCSHAKNDRALGRTAYFARPFASQRRGCNEKFNGLLRQYVSEKSLIETVPNENIQMF
jgi:IS30 family transposase